MSTYQGPPVDQRIYELRSIANSVEPLFPEGAKTLRAIAATLEDDG